MTESDWSPDVDKRIEEHLDAIDRALAAKGVTLSERRSVTDDVEAQVREMLVESSESVPTLSDVEAVLKRLDTPESYAEGTEPSLGREAPAKTEADSFGIPLRLFIWGFITLGATAVLGIWFLNNFSRIGPEHFEPFVLIFGWLAVLFLCRLAIIPVAKGINVLCKQRSRSQIDLRQILGFVLLSSGLALSSIGLLGWPRVRGVCYMSFFLMGLLTMWFGGLSMFLALKRKWACWYVLASAVVAWVSFVQPGFVIVKW